jgi:polyisoprenoid-binding protein YceI
MKKLIIAIIIAVIVIVVIKHMPWQKKQATVSNAVPENKISGFQADENATFDLNGKNSELSFVDTGSKDSLVAHVPVSSGKIVVTNGVITGNANLLVKNISVEPVTFANSFTAENAFDTKKIATGSFVLKALVFDRASSTSSNVVYRVDGELTLRGVTKAVSFVANTRFGTNSIDITGVAPFDAASFGVVMPGSGSFNLNLALSANKK